jgi:2-methylisocitrate lyase-like PEP mutase family enzyme
MSGPDAARVFHELHRDGLLILPNAWDAGSARIIEHAGAKAIATSSAAVAWSHGYPDGEAISKEALISVVREMVRVVGVPVSVDLETGYGDAETTGVFVAHAVEAGAVGVNLEDSSSPPDLLVAKIERAKEAAGKAGVDLWVNARVDVYLRKLKEGEAAYQETVGRARRYTSAGADSIFVPGASGEELIARLVRDVSLPINILAWPGVPPARKLKELGVRRLSAGSGLAKVLLNRLHVMSGAFLGEGRSESFDEGSLRNPEINRLMRRA